MEVNARNLETKLNLSLHKAKDLVALEQGERGQQ
jgi:hypothetical protein